MGYSEMFPQEYEAMVAASKRLMQADDEYTAALSKQMGTVNAYSRSARGGEDRHPSIQAELEAYHAALQARGRYLKAASDTERATIMYRLKVEAAQAKEARA